VLKRRTHARAHALVGWLSGRLDSSVRPCGRARGVAGVGVVYHVTLISFRISLIGIKSLIDCDKAIYSASIVDNDIWVCILDTHRIGTPEYRITYPVRDLAEIGCCLSSTLKKSCKI
jgi:hypothetical protein